MVRIRNIEKRVTEHRNAIAQDRKLRAHAKTNASVATRMSLQWLNNWRLPAAIVLLLLGVVCIIFVPNIFYVKHVRIEGAGPEITGQISQVIESYIQSNNGVLPQRNLLVLNQQNLQANILENGSVIRVTQIKKQFLKRTLLVTVEPKVHLFTVQKNNQLYAVYSDGVVVSAIGAPSADWPFVPDNDIIKIIAPGNNTLEVGQRYLSAQTLNQLSIVRNQFPQILQTKVAFVEFAPFLNATEDLIPVQPSSMWVWLRKNNYTNGPQPVIKVVFNPDQDLNKSVLQLQSLLEQTTPQRYKDLLYIDMRITDKAYICLINTPCALPLQPAAVSGSLQ